MAEVGDENELLDYEEEETETPADAQATKDLAKKDVKGTYVSIHSSGFRDFLLKPELLRAIVDCGFEHPSEGTLSNLAFFKFLKAKLFLRPDVYVVYRPNVYVFSLICQAMEKFG